MLCTLQLYYISRYNKIKHLYGRLKHIFYNCIALLFNDTKAKFSVKFYRIFKNYQIKLNSVICGNYALSLNEIDKGNLLEGSLKVLNGENMKEVRILPKKQAKLGFFEKMFHLFS